jgi:hypothetical protein
LGCNKWTQGRNGLSGKFVGKYSLLVMPGDIGQYVCHRCIKVVTDVIAEKLEKLAGIASGDEVVMRQGHAIKVFVIVSEAYPDKFFKHAAGVDIPCD